jgi:DNA-binding response OmpR family regulator/predicted regulator of Ras-like GTPase activity (Roadblock/LC7/MglB family)
MATGARSVLIVDDEEPFLRTVADGFRTNPWRVELVTARNGREALLVLGSRHIDLVLTDLKMPEVDGFELIAAMTRAFPDTPILVMTAFGTPEIERRLRGHGLSQYLEKPLAFKVLADRVLATLATSASGALKGITLPSFLQIIQLDRKTCALRILSRDRAGILRFERGELLDAATGSLAGDDAALEIVCWDDTQIEIHPHRHVAQRTVHQSLTELLMEGIRRKDERGRDAPRSAYPSAVLDAAEATAWRSPLGADEPTISLATPGLAERAPKGPPAELPIPQYVPPTAPRSAVTASKENDHMSAKDKLQELTNLEGFQGAAVYTPTGEELCMIGGGVANMKEVGVLANNVLMNAQKASLEMGAGRGQVVHVEGEKAQILVRCTNEGTDPLKSQPGRAHIHTVLVLKPDASLGMAKLKLGQVVDKLVEDFR